jgi:hypothetical protein
LLIMPHIVDQLQTEAATAIAAMRDAALSARRLHARAELLRHMHQTAAKLADQSPEQAIERVVREWMQAWHIDTGRYVELLGDVRHFAAAFCTDARGSTPATQAAIRETTEALDAALVRHGTSIADQMAWRSQCAHGWWDMVVPTPPDLPGRAERPGVPRYQPGLAFWEIGCAERCRPQAGQAER